MKKFRDLGLGDDLLTQLKSQGISAPTPIQELSINLIKDKKDVIAEAQTGTGKTLAFLLPMFENMSADVNKTQGLIVTPTRELAIQITQEAKKLNEAKNLNILAVYGGQDIRAQLHKLKNSAHLIIATPGRIIDHIKRETIDLDQLDTLVMDEADQMLHIGFKNEMEFIISKTPKKRQTLCFSATMSKDVNKLAYKHMYQPTVVSVEKKEITLDNIRQHLVVTTDRDKQDALRDLMKKENPFMAIIFCRTKRRVDKLDEALSKSKFNCKRLHGGMAQGHREKVMKDFKATKIQYLIATDVAARGLDISGVSHVYNYDIPENAESYIHRIGRTGRAGQKGDTYLFVAEKDQMILKEIENAIKMKIPHAPVEKRDEDFLFKGDDLYNADGSHKNKSHENKFRGPKKPSKKPSAPKSNNSNKNEKSRKKR